MARAYYFNYFSMPGAYKNSTVEAQSAGWEALKCVAKTFQEYGIKFENIYNYNSYMTGNNKFKGFVAKYGNGGIADILADEEERPTVSVTPDNKIVVDFKIDPLIPENSNDEIITDIMLKFKELYLIREDDEVHTTQSENHRGGTGAKEIKSGGCYVATAVYGTYDCPEVWTLRRFRDFVLARHLFGKVFIKIYYAISPTIVYWFGKKKWFNHFWKNKLDRLVAWLNSKGIEDDPYND